MKHPTKEKWPYRKVKPEHVPELIRRYELGESARQICLDMPFKEDVAIKVLRDFGIHIKTKKENRLSQGCTINVDAFSDPEDPRAAYYFGWLLTDGYVTKLGYGLRVGIEVTSEDGYILEGMCEYLNLPLERVVYRERESDFCGRDTEKRTAKINSLVFSFEKISDRLVSYGMEERKSLRENPSEVFQYNRHFWRGAFEGDGYISKIGSDNKLQMCGSKQMCDKWAEYCKSVVPEMNVRVYYQVNENGRKLYHAYAGKGEQCKAVLDSLYLGVPPEMRLKRKYNIYVERFYGGVDPNETSTGEIGE